MSHNDIASIQQTITRDFDLLGDWQQRYSLLIELGKKLIRDDEQAKKEKHRLYGCQANVWLRADYRDEKLYFSGTSDSVIVAGLMALLFKVYSGQKPADILMHRLTFLDDTGLIYNLTAQRSTGLAYMIERIHTLASEKILN